MYPILWSYSKDEEYGAGNVNVLEPLGNRKVGVLAFGIGKEEEDDCEGDGAKGEIDPKAPGPRELVCKGASKNGTDDRGDAEHGG
ncbi:hypothetical protein ACJQWK_05333 [Exserohilum turcicum]